MAGALALAPLGLLSALAPLAAAAGDGSLTRLKGTAGCLSVEGYRGQAGCTRVRGLGEPRRVAVSPDGHSVYVTSGPSVRTKVAAVAIFRRSSRTGALRQLPGRAGCLSLRARDGCARTRGLRYAVGDVEVSGDGRSVYVLGYEGIAVFRRSHRTGALRQLRGRDGCVRDRSGAGAGQAQPANGGGSPSGRCRLGRALALPSDLALSPSGRFVYVASGWEEESMSLQGGIAVFRRNPRTGALAQLPGAKGCATAPGRQRCGRARSIPRVGATGVTLDRNGDNLYVSAFGVVVFDRLRGGVLRQLSGLLAASAILARADAPRRARSRPALLGRRKPKRPRQPVRDIELQRIPGEQPRRRREPSA